MQPARAVPTARAARRRRPRVRHCVPAALAVGAAQAPCARRALARAAGRARRRSRSPSCQFPPGRPPVWRRRSARHARRAPWRRPDRLDEQNNDTSLNPRTVHVRSRIAKRCITSRRLVTSCVVGVCAEGMIKRSEDSQSVIFVNSGPSPSSPDFQHPRTTAKLESARYVRHGALAGAFFARRQKR